jgi:hypothetical protein
MTPVFNGPKTLLNLFRGVSNSATLKGELLAVDSTGAAVEARHVLLFKFVQKGPIHPRRRYLKSQKRSDVACREEKANRDHRSSHRWNFCDCNYGNFSAGGFIEKKNRCSHIQLSSTVSISIFLIGEDLGSVIVFKNLERRRNTLIN